MFRSTPLLSLFFVLVLAGCDYQLVGRGGTLPPGIGSIHLPTLVNRTAEPNMDVRLTQALTQQFLLDGRLKVAGPQADAVLSGTIVSYLLRPLAYDGANNVTEYQVSLAVDLLFTATADGKVLVKQRVADTSQYEVTESVAGSEEARDGAVAVAAQKMAERIVSTIIEGF
ncbi:MAG: LptE family protein [Nitrospinae bacterium]|nr:LptE family protein [Nitrospinota bacterium]